MTNIQRILVPVDFSPCSQTALDYAVFVAERFKASLEVLHVWEAPQYLGMEVMVQVPGEVGQSLSQFVQAQARQDLDKMLEPLAQRSDLKVQGRLEAGEPYDVIIRVAEQMVCDLLVVGTHGRRGLSHLLMGSVAERVVRRAPCPVLTVRQPDPNRG